MQLLGRRREAELPKNGNHNGASPANGHRSPDAELEDLARALASAREGNFGVRLDEGAGGALGRIAADYNALVDRNARLTGELQRVSQVIGREGRMRERASLADAGGAWAESVSSVNLLIDELARPTTEVARVIGAVAGGDLSQKMDLEIDGQPVQGEFRRIGKTVNSMVDQLSSFADEVTRVAREVGTEGKLGGQAEVEGVSGTWRDLTENVNFMAGNLTSQVRNIALVATAVAEGDLSQKITVDAKGEVAALADTINSMTDMLGMFAEQVTTVAREVGTEGVLGGQAEVPGVAGTWKDLTDSVNLLAGNLTSQVRNIAEVTTAVANGDLSQQITVDVKGEVAELKKTINTMVEQLRSFAAEVTRVAREVGTDGKLGGQAEVEGVSGTWRGLTENVNFMAGNLTDQVRNIAQVATAVANGDLSQKITVDAKGEILELKDTLNTMVDQLGSFAAEVTRVAREVGTEGKLGGQAQVEDVSGTWRGLTDNVNQLAANLTTQVRAIAEVSTAVTQGDLTRSIAVEAQGEVAELKDNVNQMISNLRDTTQKNAEEDWLKTNLARISGLMQGERDVATVSRLIMSELTPVVSAQHGAFFMSESPENGGEPTFRLVASYGYSERKTLANRFALGQGLVGQAAFERKPILVSDAPPDYVRISSGLGEATPVNVVVLPVLFEGEVMAVIELASLRRFSEIDRAFLEQLTETIGVVLNTIIANSRTEELLGQSQSLTQELQSRSEELQAQQEELKRSNAGLEEQAKSLKASEELLQTHQHELQKSNVELEDKAALLGEQKRDIETKNNEIEHARRDLEGKADQLALGSKYKSEFLANMSHELRTPLNSLLILAKLLAENPAGNLSEQQVEFANTIHGAGADLLELISDILDLSKVEAGRMELRPSRVGVASIERFARRTFDPMAREKGLAFTTEVGDGVPESLVTDEQRLQQVLKNLLSNAFKFTTEGGVTLAFSAEAATHGEGARIAISVTDTGIGMAPEKLGLIFEAFQQADGTTNRRYGGTGLGLSISRELAHLLGGEIGVESAEGRGSTFTLSLPGTRDPAPGADVPILAPTRSEGRAPAGAVLSSPVELDSSPLVPGEVLDDRTSIDTGDRVILIIEDDHASAALALHLARRCGFKGLVALRGDAGLALAHEYRPDAILLDVGLPGADGLSVLDYFKHQPEIRHIPVHMISGSDHRVQALRMGAAAYYEKPVDPAALEHAFRGIREFLDRRCRKLLVVEDDTRERETLGELLGGEDVDVTAVGSGQEALRALESDRFDCMVLDLTLGTEGPSGFGVLERLSSGGSYEGPPVVVYTGRDLSEQERAELDTYTGSVILKDADSIERLVEETSLHLHRDQSRLSTQQREMLRSVRVADPTLVGRRILVVDDDVRNVFALTSALENRGMSVVFAENAEDGIETLKSQAGIDLVLMDIMMPGMDGLEATRVIRGIEEFRNLPIVTLTAKAMTGDRERSLEAGASDYVTKPVDIDQLQSVIRSWLLR